jgi:peroxiredoxin
VALSGCDIQDDLLPSSSDDRSTVVAGSIGSQPTQIAADFSLKDIYGADFLLSDHLAGGSNPADVVVLYFTMWCPICTSHTDHMYTNVVPQFDGRGNVLYVLIDYVSGSYSASHATAQANGYITPKFTVLSDDNRAVMDQFKAAMGTTVIIDNDGTILMNEDYRTGATLIDILDQQLP